MESSLAASAVKSLTLRAPISHSIQIRPRCTNVGSIDGVSHAQLLAMIYSFTPT